MDIDVEYERVRTASAGEGNGPDEIGVACSIGRRDCPSPTDEQIGSARCEAFEFGSCHGMRPN